MKKVNEATRIGNMCPVSRLSVYRDEDDGDITVSIYGKDIVGELRMIDVEFCTGIGGGKNDKTLKALQKLIEAMHEDMLEFPQKYHRDKGMLPE